MKKIDKVKIYGDTENIDDRLGVISFSVDNLKYSDVSFILANKYAIATRCAKFCAHPYVYRLLNIDDNLAYKKYISDESLGLIRISLGMYNTLDEAKIFIDALREIAK
jgi:selenocysteine lyase/cysteine desulfurase